MTEPKWKTEKIRFGVFEFDTASGELYRDGIAQPRIRDQALQILLMLLERPRDLVTREELRDRLWSSDTFVDFDRGLNSAINQLRSALGDSAANPRFIQTLPRRGYRFIAPVETMPNLSSRIARDSTDADIGGSDQSEGTASRDSRLSILSDARELPSVSRRLVLILFSLIQIMYLTFYIVALTRIYQVESILSHPQIPSLSILIALIVTAAVGIPIRFYLLAATAFHYDGLNTKFTKLFPFVLPLDELWALAPFLIIHRIGFGLALAAIAALLYLPFSQRSLLLMGFSVKKPWIEQ